MLCSSNEQVKCSFRVWHESVITKFDRDGYVIKNNVILSLSGILTSVLTGINEMATRKLTSYVVGQKSAGARATPPQVT